MVRKAKFANTNIRKIAHIRRIANSKPNIRAPLQAISHQTMPICIPREIFDRVWQLQCTKLGLDDEHADQSAEALVVARSP